MRVPEALIPLVDMGVVDEVIRPLMAGKEAEVFLVRVGDELRVAKVYKDAQNRSFKHRSAYTEGRGTRNTRSQRAMTKRSRYGRAEEEAAWRSAEVDAIHRLSAADVRVPVPYDFVEGVFVMSLITGPEGEPAPRLVDLEFTRGEATALFELLVRQVVKMLCAGLIHGDLSDFNVLIGVEGPVIIDFPQAVDAAANNHARRLLLRDVRNLQHFLSRFAPKLRRKRYGEEIWALYERGELQPDTRLTGRHQRRTGATDVESILREITAAESEERRRRQAAGLEDLPERPPARRPETQTQTQTQSPNKRKRKKKPDLFDDLDALLTTDSPGPRSRR